MEKKKSRDFYHLLLTIVFSFLSLPVTYLANHAFKASASEQARPFAMAIIGSGILLSFVFVVAKASRVNDWMYYVSTLFAFTAMIDLIITLEFMGYIGGFMSEYLQLGETYLFSPWGSAICAFDATGLYIMYLLMAYQIANKISWRSTGIYWVAALFNSMVVLVLGIFTGKDNPTYCTLFNIPYAIVPVVAFKRLLQDEKRAGWEEVVRRKVVTKIFDIVLLVAHCISIAIFTLKGLAALNSKYTVVNFLLQSEPSILNDDPAPFAILQMLIYFFYLVPIQAVSAMYLLSDRKPHYLWESTLVQAGVVMQAQFSFIVQALDPVTPPAFKSNLKDSTFWFVNLLVLVVPHLMILRLRSHRRRNNESVQRKNK